MYKAIGKVVELNPLAEGKIVDITKELKKAFSKEGRFEAFKHTSSYVEIPPLTETDDSGTYIEREYRGVPIVTLGATVYLVESKELNKYLTWKPRYLQLGTSSLRVIRADASYRYLNQEGYKLVRELLTNWEVLTKPCFASRSI